MAMRTMTMSERRPAALLAGALTLALAGPAGAQDSIGDLVGFLVTNQGVATSDFDKDRAAAEATRTTIGRALLTSLATLPVSSSSGGFTYRFNPAIGTVERASQTFGPFFAERAVTAGRGQASAGFTVQYVTFSSLDGRSLRDGTFVTTANQFTDEAAPFDVESLTMSISTRTATAFGNLGVTDRLDVGVAVPFIRLAITGSRTNTYRRQSFVLAQARGESSGFGDVLVRSKLRLTDDGPAAAAAGVEVRLPTAREADLLGAGELQVRPMGLVSFESSAVSVHGNVSVGFGGVGREWTYGGAVAAAATPRVTLVGEFMARHLSGLSRIDAVGAPHPRIAGVMTTRLMPVGAEQLAAYTVGGVKWNLGGAWLLHGNVLVPLTDAGLTARVTPTVALDYSFTR